MRNSFRRENSWSSEEIDALKKGFLDGTPAKLLSLELGRSISALNKALSRFRIRNKKHHPHKNKTFQGNTHQGNTHLWRSLEFNRNALSKEFRESSQGRIARATNNAGENRAYKVCTKSNNPHAKKVRSSLVDLDDSFHEWTSMDCVIEFLISQGYNITRRVFPDKTVAYFLNRTVITETRLLVMANSIRLDMKKPIFVLENLTGD